MNIIELLKNKTPNRFYRNFLVAAPIIFIISYGIFLISNHSAIYNVTYYKYWAYLFYFLGFLGLVSIIIGYVGQAKYLKINFPQKKIMYQLYLPLFTITALIIALSYADYNGYLTFHNGQQFGYWDILFGLGIGIAIGVLFILIFSLGNEIYIATKGVNKPYHIVSLIVYIIGYVVVSLFSYAVYNVVYTLHDPSTE